MTVFNYRLRTVDLVSCKRVIISYSKTRRIGRLVCDCQYFSFFAYPQLPTSLAQEYPNTKDIGCLRSFRIAWT